MDVRCEKCQTVYEFEDAKVTAAGVTVKCTQCGNLFKVRRRSTLAHPVLSTGSENTPGPRRTTSTGMPVLQGPPSATPSAPPASSPARPRPTPLGGTPAIARRPATPSAGTPVTTGARPSDDRTWMVRSVGNGEVKRFRELTTLQQWIVEKKVVRDDEISRSGETWKRLGGIAELSSFFLVVDQAEPRPEEPPPPDPAYASTAPFGVPHLPEPLAGPNYHGADPSIPQAGPNAPTMGYLGPAALRDTPAWAAGPSPEAPREPTAPALDDEDDFDLPARGLRGSTVAFALIGALLLGGGGWIAAYKRDAVKRLFHAEDGHANEAYQRGRDHFLLDDDDSLRLADQELQRAHGANESSPAAVAALAEVNAVWGGYLRDDARASDAAHQPARADDQRKQAQAHLDDAKRYANDALNLAPDDGDASRAMAAFLTVSGAPAAQVETFLKRSESALPDEADTAFVRGWLAFREGRLEEARTRLEQASRLQVARTRHDLPRAQLLLAEIAVAQGRRDEARAALQKLLAENDKHARARALLALLESAGSDGGVAATPTPNAPQAPAPQALAPQALAPQALAPQAVAPQAPPAAPAKPTLDKPAAEVPVEARKGEVKPAEPHGFAGLIAQGNKLLERGKARDAQKLFEKALLEQPDQLEALSGLAYCYLDTEHYGAAVDTFKRILSTMPNSGEALIGLAETYKVRGDKERSLDYYKKYVAELPSGSKAAMARTNISELEAALKHAGAPTATEVHEAPPIENPARPANEPPP